MPPITLAAARKTLSSALYLGLCLATIAHFVLGAPADLRPVGAALLVYLLLEVWDASRLILGSAAARGVVWGMGAIMSPFSGTVLRVARLTNCPPFRVAWVWNARFSLAIGLPVSAVVYAVARQLRGAFRLDRITGR